MTLRSLLSFLCCLLAVALLVPAAASAADFPTVLGHYESVRLALIQDTVDGTAVPRLALASTLGTLVAEFDAEAARVAPESADSARQLLDEARRAAEQLAKAPDLETTRSAFYELTKPLVRYRELMVGDKPVVAYCSMARKSWLQPTEEIGNPYHGQSMPRCGSVVSTRAEPTNATGSR